MYLWNVQILDVTQSQIIYYQSKDSTKLSNKCKQNNDICKEANSNTLSSAHCFTLQVLKVSNARIYYGIRIDIHTIFNPYILFATLL